MITVRGPWVTVISDGLLVAMTATSPDRSTEDNDDLAVAAVVDTPVARQPDAQLERMPDHRNVSDEKPQVQASARSQRVLGLVKAFLRAGVLGEDQVRRDRITGTPQGGILTPPTRLATSASRCR